MRAPLTQADAVPQSAAFDIDLGRVGPMLDRGNQQAAQRAGTDGSPKRAPLDGNAVVPPDEL